MLCDGLKMNIQCYTKFANIITKLPQMGCFNPQKPSKLRQSSQWITLI